MAPPVQRWSAEELPERVQTKAEILSDRRRKERIDLQHCQLMELLQYHCRVEEPNRRNSRVLCEPIQRLFRKCSDRNGPFMVETTAWEGIDADKP